MNKIPTVLRCSATVMPKIEVILGILKFSKVLVIIYVVAAKMRVLKVALPLGLFSFTRDLCGFFEGALDSCLLSLLSYAS